MKMRVQGIRSRVAARAQLQHDKQTVSRQRKLAIWLTVFAAIRTIVWLFAMLLIVFHWLGWNPGLVHWTISLASTIVFVTFISFYCNASTDAANFAASIAALFSADSHESIIRSSTSLTKIKDDITKLAELYPGEESQVLAQDIHRQLKERDDDDADPR